MNKISNTDVTFSENLGHWLASNDLSLAMSCYQTGQLLFFSSDRNGEVTIHDNNFGHVMGLTHNENSLHISTFDKVIRFDKDPETSCSLSPDSYRNTVYRPVKVWEVGDIDVHEMDIDKAGDLLFVNTCYSSVSKISDQHLFETVWKPPFISELKPEHRCHLNGMCLINGELSYTSAISTADEPDGWRGRRTKTGVLIDTKRNEIVIDGLSMPHSPRMYNNSLWILESGKGFLQKVNPESYARENVAFCPGFLRGLSFHKEFAIAAMSLGRDDGFEGLEIDKPLKQNGIKPQCGIEIINVNSGNTEAWIRFEGSIREVFSVEALPNIRVPQSLNLKDGTNIMVIGSTIPEASGPT